MYERRPATQRFPFEQLDGHFTLNFDDSDALEKIFDIDRSEVFGAPNSNTTNIHINLSKLCNLLLMEILTGSTLVRIRRQKFLCNSNSYLDPL